jgi:hypothetical protein
MKAAFLAILLAVSIAGPAEARHRDPPTLAEWLAGAVEGFVRRAAAAAAASGAVLANASQRAPEWRGGASYGDEEVVSHPAGCPTTAYCGCGASVRLYGHPVRELYPAAAWRRFPRATCAAGRVAIWGEHHVAVILECRGNEARLWDPNSGSGLTRIHWRELPSLIVEPPASL